MSVQVLPLFLYMKQRDGALQAQQNQRFISPPHPTVNGGLPISEDPPFACPAHIPGREKMVLFLGVALCVSGGGPATA